MKGTRMNASKSEQESQGLSPPRRYLAAIAVVAMLAAVAGAQTPQMLEINTLYGESDGSDPSDFCTIGTLTYFAADDGSAGGHGRELWVTDGTEAGTAMVGDINNGPDSSDPQNLTAIAGTLYFSADDGANGRELWVYDGSSLTLVDVSTSGDSNPAYFAAFNGAIHFSAEGDTGDGRELWKYDGSTVSLAADVNASGESDPSELVVMGGSLYFAADNGTDGRQVMRHETGGSTALVKNVSCMAEYGTTDPEQISAYPEELTVVGTALYYTAEYFNSAVGSGDFLRRELFVTDGTEAGTARISDIGVTESLQGLDVFWMMDARDANVRELTVMNGALYFIAHDPSWIEADFTGPMHGGWTEVWTTDGTLAGTHRITQVGRPLDDGYPASDPGSDAKAEHLTVMDGYLYFAATDGTLVSNGGHGLELWRTDAAAYDNDELVKDINQFVSGDGSTGSPYINHDSDLCELCAVNTAAGNRLFLQARGGGSLGVNGTTGAELWVSDGTEAGTVLVKDLGVGADGSPEGMTPLGQSVVFSADTQGGGYGRELFISDGAEAGTHMVADVAPGPSHSEAEHLTALGDTLFLSATDAVHGYELWKTQGTAATTSLVKDIYSTQTDGSAPYDLTPLDGSLYFFRLDDTGRRPNLFRTDGTEAGTTLVHDFFPTGSPPDPQTPSEIGDPSELTAFNGALYFSAYDLELRGLEFWTSDGTDAGTYMLKDIDPSPWNPVYGDHASKPSNFVVAGDTLYLVASGSTGRDLYKSDGTEAGTVVVKNIDINPSTLWGNQPVGECVAAGDRLFWVPNTYTYGKELWVSDGTEAGTVITRDIRSGSAASNPQNLAAAGDCVFFAANDGTSGNELWVSDGTEAGTVLVSDINSGGSSNPEELVAVGDMVYFSANDGSAGEELWVCDTTLDSVYMLADINSGGSSSPADITSIGGGMILFTADDGTNGREVWISDGTAAGTRLLFDLASGADGSDPAELTCFGQYVAFLADDGTLSGRELWTLKVETTTPDAWSLEFENEYQGGSQTRTVTICNHGDVAVEIQDAVITDAAGPDLDAFSIIGTSIAGTTLDPGECVALDVEFATESAGVMTAVLHVLTTDTLHPTIKVDLQGTGSSEEPLPVSSGLLLTGLCLAFLTVGMRAARRLHA